MRSGWTPSIVPNTDATSYLVVDDLGSLGRIYSEAQVDQADLETIIDDLISGQYNDPIRVVAFNISEGWSQDVSADIAAEIQLRSDMKSEDVSSRLQAFVDRHAGQTRQLALRLV